MQQTAVTKEGWLRLTFPLVRSVREMGRADGEGLLVLLGGSSTG
jgi:hypothetical protein